MLHEFAVEPEAVNSWERVRYIVDSLGVPKGRLLARLPNKWRRRVTHICKERHLAGEIEGTDFLRLVEALKKAEDSFWDAGPERVNDPGVSWVENAVNAHRLRPFRAIVTAEAPGQCAVCLPISEITDAPACLWHVCAEVEVPRTAKAIAECVEPLLRNSTKLMLVDYQLFHNHVDGFLRVLRALLLKTPGCITSVQYHTQYRAGRPDQLFEGICMQQAASFIPSSCTVEFTRWSQQPGGKQLHRRFLLTDRGGIALDPGLDDSQEPGDRTTLTLLPAERHRVIWADFQSGATVFARKKPVLVQGRGQDW